MASRLVIDGKVRAGSRDAMRLSDVARLMKGMRLQRPEGVAPKRGDVGRYYSDLALGTQRPADPQVIEQMKRDGSIDGNDPNGPNPHVVARKVGRQLLPVYHLPPRAGEPVADEDGVLFRVVRKLDPVDGWCLAEQLTEHYRVPYEVLRAWALQGVVDPAVELGSQVKRFRVRDPRRTSSLAAAWRRKHEPAKARIKPIDRERFGVLLEKKHG